MKLELHGWLGVASNIAVLAGILLLLVELNQNNALARAHIHQARTDSISSQRLANADSEFVAPLINKMGTPGNVDALDSLTPLEVTRLVELHESIILNIDNMHYQYQQGYLDEEYWEYRLVPLIRQNYAMWKALKVLDGGRPSFISEVERIYGSAAN